MRIEKVHRLSSGLCYLIINKLYVIIFFFVGSDLVGRQIKNKFISCGGQICYNFLYIYEFSHFFLKLYARTQSQLDCDRFRLNDFVWVFDTFISGDLFSCFFLLLLSVFVYLFLLTLCALYYILIYLNSSTTDLWTHTICTGLNVTKSRNALETSLRNFPI